MARLLRTHALSENCLNFKLFSASESGTGLRIISERQMLRDFGLLLHVVLYTNNHYKTEIHFQIL